MLFPAPVQQDVFKKDKEKKKKQCLFNYTPATK